MTKLQEEKFDEMLLGVLILIFLGAWIFVRADKMFELVFGTLTALLGILKGKHVITTRAEEKNRIHHPKSKKEITP